jgi:hypothetical protein
LQAAMQRWFGFSLAEHGAACPGGRLSSAPVEERTA